MKLSLSACKLKLLMNLTDRQIAKIKGVLCGFSNHRKSIPYYTTRKSAAKQLINFGFAERSNEKNKCISKLKFNNLKIQELFYKNNLFRIFENFFKKEQKNNCLYLIENFDVHNLSKEEIQNFFAGLYIGCGYLVNTKKDEWPKFTTESLNASTYRDFENHVIGFKTHNKKFAVKIQSLLQKKLNIPTYIYRCHFPENQIVQFIYHDDSKDFARNIVDEFEQADKGKLMLEIVYDLK